MTDIMSTNAKVFGDRTCLEMAAFCHSAEVFELSDWCFVKKKKSFGKDEHFEMVKNNAYNKTDTLITDANPMNVS